MMGRVSFRTSLLLAVALSGRLLFSQAMPRLSTVTPDTGKAGDVITTEGENLEKAHVAELYMTDGKEDIKVVMSEQTATTIKFTVPAKVKAGSFNLMILTTGAAPKLLVQPVKLTIE
jgi:hypothetical protein